MAKMKEVGEPTYLELNGTELLKGAGLTKSAFAEMVGIAKQNVDTFLSTKNVCLIKKASAVLNIPVDVLIDGPKTDATSPNECIKLNGFVELNGEIRKISSVEDLNELLAQVEIIQKSNKD